MSEILKICGTTSTVYSINDITRRFNASMDDYLNLAFEADGRWPFDEITRTDPPLESLNLSLGINKYKLSDLTADVLNLLRIEVLDSAGNSRKLIPEDLSEIDSFAEKYKTTVTGIPTKCLKMGNFVYVRPTPDYSKASGITFYFDQASSKMTVSDTTREPGIPSIHHLYLARKTALPFLIEKKLPQLAGIAAQIAKDEENILDYFARRDKSNPTQIRTKYRSSR